MVETKRNGENCYAFLSMYSRVMNGNTCAPRGSKIREVEDFMFSLNTAESCITSFRDRHFNLSYAINEFLWYLRGDAYDKSIEAHASTWPKIIQPGGFYYSNYGQYMFGKQAGVMWVVEELRRDKDSRRAAFPLLRGEHCFADNRDMVCTYSMGFRIRNDQLNMSVNMRSNDVIYGTTNDVFCFWMVYKLVYALLRREYPSLTFGRYTHKVDSLHVYEKHWGMIRNIVMSHIGGYMYVHAPDPIFEEAWDMITTGDIRPHLHPHSNWEFSRWLIANSQKV